MNGTRKTRFPMFATMERIPGGLMLIPLILGSLIGTFAPGTLEIGSFTTALFSIGTSRLGDVSLITLVAVAAAVLVTAVMAPTVAAFVLRREGGLRAATPRPLVEEGVA